VLASLLKNYTFELKKDYKMVMESAVTNKPLYGLPLKVQKRK